MAADPIAYCLENITDYIQFERLCNDLMVLEGYDSLVPLGGFKDKGRDAIHVASDTTKTATIFSYSVREDWRKKLDEDVAKVVKHGHKCDRFVYLSTTQPANSDFDKAIREVKAKQSWDLEVYHLERLRTLLAVKHQKVITLHPQLFPPPFFPLAGGVVIADSPDLIVIDSHVTDDALATWLTRKLRLQGYLVWSRSLAPMAGSSLNDTIEALLRHRTARYLPLLSPEGLKNPDFASRRALASSLNSSLTIPVMGHAINANDLDAKTRQMEAAHFESSWATGWQQLILALDAKQTPKASPDAPLVLRSFFPPGIVLHQPETIYSNRFQVKHVPSVVRGYSAFKKVTSDEMRKLQPEWAAKRIDDYRLLSFVPPPKAIIDRFQLKEKGGAVWQSVKEVEGVRSDYLASELISKAMQVHWRSRGLLVCPERGSVYFPENLCKSDRLYFQSPDGGKPFVGTYGRRKNWTPTATTYYRYHLSPRADVKTLETGRFVLFLRVGVRITDDSGKLFPGTTGNARRKKLCRSWFNDEIVNRTFALMQFAADGKDEVELFVNDKERLVVARDPDSWIVPIRIDEAAIPNAKENQDELLAHSRDDVDGEESDVREGANE